MSVAFTFTELFNYSFTSTPQTESMAEAAAGGGDAEMSTTLVKYNNPILVIKHPEKMADKKVSAVESAPRRANIACETRTSATRSGSKRRTAARHRMGRTPTRARRPRRS